MKKKKSKTPRLIADIKKNDAAICKAVQEALADHKRAGNPVAGWENGQVVIVPPHKIPDFGDEN